MHYFLSTAFCLSILTMTTNLCGQKNYLPGSVTKINGTTETGWVDYRNWQKNPRSIGFKSAKGQEAQLSSKDLALFEVMRSDKKLERYKRAIVQVDLSPTKLEELDANPLPVFKTDTLLLLVLMESDLDLYFLVDEADDFHFFYGTNESEEIKELVHKEYIQEGTQRVVVNYQYRKQLLELAQDCKEINLKDMTALRYEMVAIMKMAKAINICLGNKPSYVFEAERQQFEFQVNAGANLIGYGIDSKDTNIDQAEYDPRLGLTAGVGINWQVPRTQGKILLSAELSYAQLKAEGLYVKPFSTLGYSRFNSKLEISQLSLQFGPEWRFYKGKFTPYVNANFVLNHFLKTNQSGSYVIEYNDGHTAFQHEHLILRDLRKNNYGLSFGLGTFLPGGHWHVETRFGFNVGLSLDAYSDDVFKSLGIALGYNF